MQRLTAALVLAVSVAGVSVSGRVAHADLDNIAAFARLFGVVRYFYPSDAAAELDWNRFAVYGVGRVQSASGATQLSDTLTSLVSPLGPGIEIGARLSPAAPEGVPDPRMIAWRYLGAGMDGAGGPGPYRGQRTKRAGASQGIDGFVSMMQTAPAIDLRGKTIRLSAKVRADARGAAGSAALWLRVDRSNQAMGFFDNMGNRPIRESGWQAYAIEGPVADDAIDVAFGAMAVGAIVADFDAFRVSVRGSDGRWTPVPVKDPGFEAPAGTASGWARVGSSRNAVITWPADHAPDGRQFLRLASPAGAPASTSLFQGPAPRTGSHVDVDLGSGLKARVPLALSEAEAALPHDHGALDALRTAMNATHDTEDPPGLETRLAGVVVAWNVFRHFYPYWQESSVDWDQRLRPQLEAAHDAETRAALLDALRLLVADARDGHGGVIDTRVNGGTGLIPVQLGVVDAQVVITASDAPIGAPVGAVVSAMNGIPVVKLLARRMSLASGTTQWKQTRALVDLARCDQSTTVTVVVNSGAGPRTSRLRCDTNQPPSDKRPSELVELTPGVWYVDLTRVQMPQLTHALPSLAGATGVVFDMRGYPTDAGAGILPHLLDAAETDRWMHIAEITGPFGQVADWQHIGWNLQPADPRLRGRIVFLTDGRAISYAESVMGYVADHKLGTIVGGTTAGTNGNVASFAVPAGFVVSFTGMRVTRHDGRTPYHLAGVTPDVPVAPTIAGVRAGRDEVLERALALIRSR